MKSSIYTFLKHVLTESIESISLQGFQLNPKPSFSPRTQGITQRYQDFQQITDVSPESQENSQTHCQKPMQ